MVSLGWPLASKLAFASLLVASLWKELLLVKSRRPEKFLEQHRKIQTIWHTETFSARIMVGEIVTGVEFVDLTC